MSRVRYRSCETTSAWRSIAMAELLSTIVVIGMEQRTAVSKSSPVMPNAASPMKFTQNLSGAAQQVPGRVDGLTQDRLGVAEDRMVGGVVLVEIALVVGRVDDGLARRNVRGHAVLGEAAADAQHHVGA